MGTLKVISAQSRASHHCVILNEKDCAKNQLKNTGYVKIISNTSSMIVAYTANSQVAEGTIELHRITHAQYLSVAQGDLINIVDVSGEEFPKISNIQVLILKTGAKLSHPSVQGLIYVEPGYRIFCKEGVAVVKQGTGIYKYDSSDMVKELFSEMSLSKSECELLTGTTSININFCYMGIGGLKQQMSQLIRQVLISRIIGDEMRDNYKVKDIKGILLYGPPGTGKTSIARKIGNIIPGAKITNVNGPELSSKYYGETEEKVRSIFKTCSNTKLHVIIFDEIDAIGKKRGSGGSSGIDDKVLTQLLTMIDGLNPNDNTLVIGITNRKDVLDDALIRSGRLECHIEIPLPTEEGRKEILDIYLNPLSAKSLLEDNVDTSEIAKIIEGYSGADIESLINRSKNLALLRNCDITDVSIKAKERVELSKVSREDIIQSISEFNPTFSKNDDTVKRYIANYPTDNVNLEVIRQILQEISDEMIKPYVIDIKTLIKEDADTLESEAKRAIACHAANMLGSPYIKYISYNDFLGKSSNENCSRLYDIYVSCLQSENAVLILDSLTDVGDRALIMRERFISNNPLLKGKKLIIIKVNDDYF